jgi:glutathione S-transferase
MITLFAFGPMFGLADASPFVSKAHLLLRFAKLPYETNLKGFDRAPKKKLPYLNDDGQVVCDSTFIRLHIEQKYRFDFDLGLNQEQRGLAWAIEKMLDDHFYFTIVHARWANDQNFALGPANFFNAVPAPLRWLIKRVIRGKVVNGLKAQGIGRHNDSEIALLAGKCLAALAAILADKTYFMGETPSGCDASAYAFISSALCPLFDTPIRNAAESHTNLVRYVARMNALYFPELSHSARPA